MHTCDHMLFIPEDGRMKVKGMTVLRRDGGRRATFTALDDGNAEAACKHARVSL